MALKKRTVKLLGRPLHTMLIPFPLGLLRIAVLFDLMAAIGDHHAVDKASS